MFTFSSSTPYDAWWKTLNLANLPKCHTILPMYCMHSTEMFFLFSMLAMLAALGLAMLVCLSLTPPQS